MRIEASESVNGTDCGVATTTSPGKKNIAGQPLTNPVFANPQNPGPEIDARIRPAIAALRREHPEIPENLMFLGL